MTIIFFVLLFIIQIILFIASIVKKQRKIIRNNFVSISISIICLIIYSIVFYLLDVDKGWNTLALLIIGMIVAIPNILLLLISLLTKFIIKKKIINDSNDNKKYIIMPIVLTFIIFIVFTIIDMKPFVDERIVRNKKADVVINYLIEQYGQREYEVESVEYLCCGLFGDGERAYLVTLKDTELDNEFQVKINEFDDEILNDTFIEGYYGVKLNTKDFEESLIQYKISSIKYKIFKDYNIEFSFDMKDVKDYKEYSYNEIPSLDELAEYVELYNPVIDIKEDIRTKKELQDYLVKLTKCYILNYNELGISYTANGQKYFNFKYDYSKLGVNNYSGHSNKYSGYVRALYSTNSISGNVIEVNILGESTVIEINDIDSK